MKIYTIRIEKKIIGFWISTETNRHCGFLFTETKGGCGYGERQGQGYGQFHHDSGWTGVHRHYHL